MSGQKVFNWDNLRENTISQIKQEAQSLGVKFGPKDKKPQMLEKLLIAKSGMDQSFQQSMSATNSPKLPTASNINRGSKTPNVTSKKGKGRPPKQPVNDDTYINPILLGNSESPELSPTIQLGKTEKKQLEPLPQQEITQIAPEKHSPQPQQPERHSPSPQRYTKRNSPSPQPQERHSPSPQQPQEKHSHHTQRVPTPERNPSSSWSPTPERKHNKKRASRSPSLAVKYGSGYSSDYEYDDGVSSRTVPTIYRILPYLLIILLIISIVYPPLIGLVIILGIYYLYLRSKYNNRKSRKNILKY